MGTDINGWVEVLEINPGLRSPYHKQWVGLVKADNIVRRNYDMFGSLFGVANHTHLSPVVANRGLPGDLSEEVIDTYVRCEEDSVAPTWITWAEIKAIDWNEEAVDGRPHQYKLNHDGQWNYAGKSAGSIVGRTEGDSWMVGETLYRIERIKRRDMLDARWQLLFDLMQRLAQEYGDEGIRLVVWFDQ
jgi:hypothetical protein